MLIQLRIEQTICVSRFRLLDLMINMPYLSRSSSYTMLLRDILAHSKVTLGDRSFSFDSSIWKFITSDVRCAPSLSSFKSRLTTYLFRSVYKD